jgi:DNA gyrase subunit A
VDAEAFKDVRRNGLIAISLNDGDELNSALFISEKEEVSVVTSKGQSIRFKDSDIRVMGRNASGVRAIKLGKGDTVVGTDIIKKEMVNPALLVVSSNGYGKKTPLKEYKIQKRGGSGIKTMKVTSKTGEIISAKVVTDGEDEIAAISKKSQVIRVEVKEIPSLGRQTQGVRIMRLREGDSIASVTCI